MCAAVRLHGVRQCDRLRSHCRQTDGGDANRRVAGLDSQRAAGGLGRGARRQRASSRAGGPNEIRSGHRQHRCEYTNKWNIRRTLVQAIIIINIQPGMEPSILLEHRQHHRGRAVRHRLGGQYGRIPLAQLLVVSHRLRGRWLACLTLVVVTGTSDLGRIASLRCGQLGQCRCRRSADDAIAERRRADRSDDGGCRIVIDQRIVRRFRCELSVDR